MSTKYTAQDALEALESLDDCARMDTGVDAIGPRNVLRSFIEQQTRQPEVDDEMVKRAARAMWEIRQRGASWDDALESIQRDWMSMARAALTAICPDRPAQEKAYDGKEFTVDEVDAACRRAVEVYKRVEKAEPVAWLADDGTGRVIDAKAKSAGSRAAATGAATAVYSIPLYIVPPAERVRVPDGWKPIDTAPKSTADGTRVNGIYLLGFVPDPEEDFDRQALIDIIWWEPLLRNPRGGRGVWRRSAGGESVDVEPTHWMPLPMAPEADHG